jgi:hypothetical protein
VTARRAASRYGEAVNERQFQPRFLGSHPAAGAYTRIVDRAVLWGEAIDIRTLLAQLVSDRTRYLILDLDRTIHLGRNMGELLGWELAALRCYGKEGLEALEATRTPGRFLLDPKRPLATAHYLARGMASWAYPGLHYLLWGKTAPRTAAAHRRRDLRFGSEPHHRVQTVPAMAMLHELSTVPVATARELAARVFARHAADQVIERADLDWLRRRHPQLTIVLSSASPEPVVAAAAEALGIDAYEATTLAQQDGYPAAPHRLHPLFLAPRAPRQLCPPHALRVNSGQAKIARLLARFPDLLDPAVESVGITDTSHGEDAAFAQYFTHVADINSPTPFAPIVAAESPLQSIHSAQVLTRGERDRRAAGEDGYLDPRRRGAGAAGREGAVVSGRMLAARIGDLHAEVEELAARLDAVDATLAPARSRLDARLDAAAARMEQLVARYNAAEEPARAPILAGLRAQLRIEAELRSERNRLLRPVNELAHEIERRLPLSRQRLDAAAGPGAQAQRLGGRQLGAAALA